MEISLEESNFLAWEITNEVVHGFRVDDFKRKIGSTEEEFASTSKRLRAIETTENVQIEAFEAVAYRNALALTLYELGEDEFETRTGFDFDKGGRILREMNFLLLEKGLPGAPPFTRQEIVDAWPGTPPLDSHD